MVSAVEAQTFWDAHNVAQSYDFSAYAYVFQATILAIPKTEHDRELNGY